MPKVVENALSPARVRQERTPGRYADGNGLYLHVVVSPKGVVSRFFEWRGVVQGKRRTIAIGPARLIRLASARETAREWSRIARAGGDPKEARDAGKRRSVTFGEAAMKAHADKIKDHLSDDESSQGTRHGKRAVDAGFPRRYYFME